MEWFDQTIVFKLYVIGFVGSLLVQTITQSKFGENSSWGINRGWQNEIAIWNIFAAMALLSLIISGFHSTLVIAALGLLSIGFALNHLRAYMRERKVSNLQGAIANAIGIMLICLWLFFGH